MHHDVDVTPKYSPDGLPQAVEHPKPIVLIGCWILFLPPLVVFVVAIATQSPPEGIMEWLEGIGFGVTCLGAAYLLFAVNRSFFRHRHSARKVNPK